MGLAQSVIGRGGRALKAFEDRLLVRLDSGRPSVAHGFRPKCEFSGRSYPPAIYADGEIPW
jgi:hypothetical protein